MAQVELIMPKMGESIMEATILKWTKQVGDAIELDETVLEIATDKVDSEIPSPVAGKLVKIFFNENDVVPIGKAIALIETEAGAEVQASPAVAESYESTIAPSPKTEIPFVPEPKTSVDQAQEIKSSSDRFYSPLVRNIAKEENIAQSELDSIPGSGLEGRVTKKDLIDYISRKKQGIQMPIAGKATVGSETPSTPTPTRSTLDGNVEIIEMDRMRRLIADHMVKSKQTSAHVTSFVETDVTNIVNWRNKIKKSFMDRYQQNITFTPIFIEAIARAIGDFPMINISVEGDKILLKKDINIGMAAALPSGNLIVPVIRQADTLNLIGITKAVNDLATRARENKLKPEEIQGGTFTLTNVGTFGNVMGTPIINQPQVAIMATGAIRKKPAVLETPYGDVIAIRHMMFLSMSYDHRVVDGSLGGSFIKRVSDYLEGFDVNREL